MGATDTLGVTAGRPSVGSIRYFTTIPKPERTRILGEILHHMTENLNVPGLFYDVEPMAISNRVAKLEPKKAELSSVTWNVREWELK